jgi:hypothetical protein
MWIARRTSRVVVPSALLFAATAKFTSWPYYVSSLRGLALRFEWAPGNADFLAYLLPCVEATVAVLIAITGGRAFQFAAWAGFLACLTFVAFRLHVLLSGLKLTCPCFGNVFPTDRFSPTGLLIPGTLAVMTALLFFGGDPIDETSGPDEASSHSRVPAQEAGTQP